MTTLHPWYRHCNQCGVMMILPGPGSPLTTCNACFRGQRAGKRYVDNVTPIKPGERMSNVNDQDKPPGQGTYEQTPSISAVEKWRQEQATQPGSPNQSQYAGTGKGQAGLKDDGGKLMWNLLPWKACEGMVKVLTFGAKKYAPQGWRSVPNAKDRYTAALLRHLAAVQSGQANDPDSGLRHIDHILCNAAFLAELED